MIKTINLTKKFGKLTAVDNLNLEVKSGELFGFLGPNGAGKTTTFKLIVGLLQPTSGTVTIGGHDILKDPINAKSIIGFIPDQPFIYPKLSGKEFLRFICGLYGLDHQDGEKRIPELLELFELSEWGNELVESYSHGMRQRLVMASALIHKPKVIVIDEPMVGLDPRGAKMVKEIFRGMAREGVSIFMSTHTLEVAEQMCDRIGIIQNGRLIAVGTISELRQLSGIEGKHLESIFLKLTGGEKMKEIIKVLQS
ncbi:MAG: ABC transporter ATP-binding protein [Deltaproteobacteria bacterium]|nr:MAG: ABC transporter ATP-binding protein [Deltaproteobacteria bacterium]